MKSNIDRLKECLTCKYWKMCDYTVKVPEDYPDGNCKTKERLRRQSKK